MTLAMIQNFIVHNGIYSAKKLADSGDNQGAEKCYKDTLRLAMNIAGDKSVLAGTVFLELADFYELDDEMQKRKFCGIACAKFLFATCTN